MYLPESVLYGQGIKVFRCLLFFVQQEDFFCTRVRLAFYFLNFSAMQGACQRFAQAPHASAGYR